ncbi:MAG: hypothetical protein N2Z72_00070 [Bacteroidales bacterium]|nr:hypothetical protein [Bacteroidales bacterium]
MRKHKSFIGKWIWLSIICILFFTSCGSSQYRSYKRYVKRKYSAMGYRSHYQKKIRAYTMPINKNYMIRQRNTIPRWL